MIGIARGSQSLNTGGSKSAYPAVRFFPIVTRLLFWCTMQRRLISISGVVQGVGFRPFVFRLAERLGVAGSVRNGPDRVLIDVEGTAERVDQFLTELTGGAPVLSRIDQVQVEVRPASGATGFRIDHSDAAAAAWEPAGASVPADVATCEECLAELLDPADRRYRYPFTNCTNCGPRLSILTGTPYDRERTTMARFALCPDCLQEYENPRDRRFHAQPLACSVCGPRLMLVEADGTPLVVEDPLRQICRLLREGCIAAIKGLGGYHLACDASNSTVVLELRRRKHRDEKPFAVMVGDMAQAEALCEISSVERGLLMSPASPIVLLQKRADAGIADAVAPLNGRLGVMLPYTPLHHLLCRELGKLPLVMTSGNRSEEPIACDDREALQRLAGLADVFLIHDRPIHVRCEDSVVRVEHPTADPSELQRMTFIRRSRGYAPLPIRLPVECLRPILAVGGQLKGTFALARGSDAIVSHHLGDLHDRRVYSAFVKDVALYEELFSMRPNVIAHDLHPEYTSTEYARRRAAAAGPSGAILLEAVQHHHAHLAACLAEHRLCGPAIGVVFDGSGYGLDGTFWGGEFLVGGLATFRRVAHLRPVGLPGGDRAVREPWRIALTHLIEADAVCIPFEQRLNSRDARLVRQMLHRRLNTPMTTSAGRLFDAVAALCGVRQTVSYEGQAAMELEYLSAPLRPDGVYPFRVSDAASNEPEVPLEIDTRPLVAAIAEDVRYGTSAARIGRRFHSTLVEIIVAVCSRIRDNTGLGRVVLSGGVFTNELLSTDTAAELRSHSFEVLRHRLVPANDGGLSLGQLAVAAARGGSGICAHAAEDSPCV